MVILYTQECGLGEDKLFAVRRKGTAKDCNITQTHLDDHTIFPSNPEDYWSRHTKNTILVSHLKLLAEQVMRMSGASQIDDAA